MSEINWLEPTRTISRGEAEGADVRIKTTLTKGIPNTYITFYNDSEAKIIRGNRMMVGISDTMVYLKEPEGLAKGRRVVKSGRNKNAILQIHKINFAEIFKSIDGMQGYYKLQKSVSKDCWFIAESGKVADL